jgi:hypothetical protein
MKMIIEIKDDKGKTVRYIKQDIPENATDFCISYSVGNLNTIAGEWIKIKEKKWQWLYKYDNEDFVRITNHFYTNEDDIKKEIIYGGPFKIIRKVEE